LKDNSSLAIAALLVGTAVALWPAGAAGDVVVLKSGRAYAGVIERQTTESVRLFDGNLKRVFALGDVKRVVRERPDTSWLLVGDLMLEQGDFKTAAEAYHNALEQTNQPDVMLERLERLKMHRFYLKGGQEALSLLENGKYDQAIPALHKLARQSKGLGQQNYWTNQLARACVGLAASEEEATTGGVNPLLVYALNVGPQSGAAHAMLGEHLVRQGYRDLGRRELLLALDFAPTDARARRQLANLNEEWSYDAAKSNRSGLRELIEGRTPADLPDEPPLTAEAATEAVRVALAEPGTAIRVLTAAYLLDPTAALGYRGDLPYSGYTDTVNAILKETADPSGKNVFDPLVIGAAIKHKIDPRYVRAMSKVRAKLNPAYRGPDGARGFIPLTPEQWAIAARRAKVDWSFERKADEPEQNVPLAVEYLDWLREEPLAPFLGDRLANLERVVPAL
jgi:tetratricopeptide (TPR) repeat protein